MQFKVEIDYPNGRQVLGVIPDAVSEGLNLPSAFHRAMNGGGSELLFPNAQPAERVSKAMRSAGLNTRVVKVDE